MYYMPATYHKVECDAGAGVHYTSVTKNYSGVSKLAI